jgi:integrase
MKITFGLEALNSKGSPDKYSIFIRCTQNRKHKRIHTGVSVSAEHWNKQKQQVRKSHPQHQAYNQLIQTQLKNVLETYHQLVSTHKDINLQTLTEALQGNQQQDFFVFAFNTKLQEIKSLQKMGTYRRYETVLHKLKAFTGEHLPIQQINYALLKQYETHLITHHKNTRDTVSSNLSVIRTILNEAIRHDAYQGRNPFDHFTLKYTDNTKEKLTIEELKRFMHTPLPPIPSLLLARDFFTACFLAEGSRAGDMISMKKECLQGNILTFTQQKTGAKMQMMVVPQLMDIFSRYMQKDSVYIFPFLHKETVVNERVIGSKLAYINKYIKEVCKYAGILKKVSSHVARHTYTDIALQVSGGNIYQVQQSLGHRSVRTTEIYSRNRVNQQKNSIMMDIVGMMEE